MRGWLTGQRKRGGSGLSDFKIIRFEPDGPAEKGLETWEAIDPTGVAGDRARAAFSFRRGV